MFYIIAFTQVKIGRKSGSKFHVIYLLQCQAVAELDIQIPRYLEQLYLEIRFTNIFVLKIPPLLQVSL
jgi:hypothetical protein